MDKWRPWDEHPNFLIRNFGDRVRGFVTAFEINASFKWCVADYNRGKNQWLNFDEGQEENVDRAKRAAENAAAGYVRTRPPPLSSPVRNRLRMARLTAKEAAADLGTARLNSLFWSLHRSEQEEPGKIAEQVKAILRATAFEAFASYCDLATRILIDHNVMEKPHDGENQVAMLIEEIRQLGENAQIPKDGELPNGENVYETFKMIKEKLENYGFVSAESLVSAVGSACYTGIIPGPLFAGDFPHLTSFPQEYLKGYADLARKEEEF